MAYNISGKTQQLRHLDRFPDLILLKTHFVEIENIFSSLLKIISTFYGAFCSFFLCLKTIKTFQNIYSVRFGVNDPHVGWVKKLLELKYIGPLTDACWHL